MKRWRIAEGARCVAAAAALMAVLLALPSSAHAVTLPDRISSDTTLSAGNHVMTGRVQVENGHTLVLAPGAVLNGNGHSLEVFGELRAAGTDADNVVLKDVDLKGLGISAAPSLYETYTINIEHATIDGGALQGGGGSMYGSWRLANSVISNTDDAMFLWFPVAECVIEDNVFLNAGKISCGVADADVTIRRNAFFRTVRPTTYEEACVDNWAAYGTGAVNVSENDFLNAGYWTLAVPKWSGVPNMRADANYWGASDTSTVQAMIFDRHDDLASPGTVDMGSIATTHVAAVTAERLPFGVSAAIRTPALTAPRYLASVRVSTTVTTSDTGVPVRGALLDVQSSANGLSWATVKRVSTNSSGHAEALIVTPAKTFFRFVMVNGGEALYGQPSAMVTVSTRASLSTPSSSRTRPRRGTRFVVSGALRPKHSAGLRSVKLYFYRYERYRGKMTWRLKKTSSPRNLSAPSTYTKYAYGTSLPSAGRWRIRAVHSDAGHLKTYSTYRYITVQ